MTSPYPGMEFEPVEEVDEPTSDLKAAQAWEKFVTQRLAGIYGAQVALPWRRHPKKALDNKDEVFPKKT